MFSDAYGHDIQKTIADMLHARIETRALVRDSATERPLDSVVEIHAHRYLVKVDDVDAWLESVGVSYRFPPAAAEFEVQEEAGATQTRPLQQQRFQETEILRVIKELGYTATALPKNKSGKAGVKAAVNAKLPWEGTIFNKAWERLSTNKDIAYKSQ